MMPSPRMILVDNGLPIATPTFVDPDGTPARQTARLRAFLAGARERSRRRAMTGTEVDDQTSATAGVALVCFTHGPEDPACRVDAQSLTQECAGL